MDLIIKLLNLFMTIGFFILLWQISKKPIDVRSVSILVSNLMFIAVPLGISIIVMGLYGKWDGVFFTCALVNICALSIWAGYRYGRRYRKDAFETAMFAGLGSLIIFGGPLAAYFLP